VLELASEERLDEEREVLIWEGVLALSLLDVLESDGRLCCVGVLACCAVGWADALFGELTW